MLEALKIAVALAVPGLMLAEGLAVEAHQLLYLARRPGLFARSVLAVLFAVPLIAALCVLLLHPEPAVGVGLAVLASCPVAPLALGRARRAGGNPDYVAGLHLSLALLSILSTPVTLALLGQVLEFGATIRPSAVAFQVGRSLVLPFALGVAARTLTPAFAARVRRPLAVAASAVILVAVAVLLAATGGLLLRLELRSYVAMAVMLVASLAAGQLLAGGTPAERTTLALESAVRNPGLALLIASLNFGPRAALPVIIPFLVVTAALAALYSARRRRVARG